MIEQTYVIAGGHLEAFVRIAGNTEIFGQLFVPDPVIGIALYRLQYISMLVIGSVGKAKYVWATTESIISLRNCSGVL